MSRSLIVSSSPDCLAVQEQSGNRPLILVSGFIHDVSTFLDEHPGGRHLLVKSIGKDATTAFFGGVYDHSNAAHNVCRRLRLPTVEARLPLSVAFGNEARRCPTWGYAIWPRGQEHTSEPTTADCEV
jgi:cytochrome b involved in lipid metabolism